jgi:hypothetical protein
MILLYNKILKLILFELEIYLLLTLNEQFKIIIILKYFLMIILIFYKKINF